MLHAIERASGAPPGREEEFIVLPDEARRVAGYRRVLVVRDPLRRLGLDVPVRHLNRLDYDAARRPAGDLPPAELRGAVPTAEWFYDDETHAIAVTAYAGDVAFHERATGLTILAPRRVAHSSLRSRPMAAPHSWTPRAVPRP